jgi:hypothetical protein
MQCPYPLPVFSPIPHKKKRQYKLLETYSLVWNGQLIIIPAGFIFDGASIPAAAWPITYSPFLPQVIIAALIHDWIYATHCLARYEADILFKDICLGCYASKFRAEMMYYALHLFGSFTWKWSEEDKEKIRALYEKVRLQDDFNDFIILESLVQQWDLGIAT